MDDLISRQAAIKAIKEDKIDLSNPNVVAVFKATGDFEKMETQVMTCDRHIKILKDLPSAKQWIPCSEWLPHGSCSDLVNVSIHDDSGDTPFDYTSCGWVTTDGEYWIVDNEINNHVIAWMPLPEPYTERRTDDRLEM